MVILVVMVILVIALLKFTAEMRSLTTENRRIAEDAAKNLLRLEKTVDRIEATDKVVAGNLADSVSRADATKGPEGAAADAALRTGDTAKKIRKRQAEGGAK